MADHLWEQFPKVVEAVDEAEKEVLAHMVYSAAEWSKISSTNLLERVNKEIKRRNKFVDIFPNDGAVLTEQTEEWAAGRRYRSLDSLQRVDAAELDRNRPWFSATSRQPESGKRLRWSMKAFYKAF